MTIYQFFRENARYVASPCKQISWVIPSKNDCVHSVARLRDLSPIPRFWKAAWGQKKSSVARGFLTKIRDLAIFRDFYVKTGLPPLFLPSKE